MWRALRSLSKDNSTVAKGCSSKRNWTFADLPMGRRLRSFPFCTLSCIVEVSLWGIGLWCWLSVRIMLLYDIKLLVGTHAALTLHQRETQTKTGGQRRAPCSVMERSLSLWARASPWAKSQDTALQTQRTQAITIRNCLWHLQEQISSWSDALQTLEHKCWEELL